MISGALSLVSKPEYYLCGLKVAFLFTLKSQINFF